MVQALALRRMDGQATTAGFLGVCEWFGFQKVVGRFESSLTCLRGVCRGSSDIGGLFMLSNAMTNVNPPWSFQGFRIEVGKRACELHVELPEAPGRVTRASRQ